ncbi:MAG: hypothetical protein ACTSUS_10120 [Candidatus Freyarchaeota archaeon]
MVEEEKVKKLVELRTLIEKRVQDMETELEGLRTLLEFINSLLLEKGFKRAEITRPPPAPPPLPKAVAPPPLMEYKQVVPLKAVTGELLATLYMGEDSIRVVPAEGKEFNVNTPPFTSFLVGKVLSKMQDKDREAVRTGEIPPDKILSYSIRQDGDIIREIMIRNVAPERMRELKSTIRWTLEKMWEKMTM